MHPRQVCYTYPRCAIYIPVSKKICSAINETKKGVNNCGYTTNFILIFYIDIAGNLPTSTKVVYFTPRSVTPFMSNISKSLTDVTLRDFKLLFDKPGFYRYHFKTVDPEFGMVKEEVIYFTKIYLYKIPI